MAARSKSWVCGRSHGGIVGLNPAGAKLSVSCECCVLSSTDLCVGLIAPPESPTECDLPDCDHGASIMRRPWPTWGLSRYKKRVLLALCYLDFMKSVLHKYGKY